MSTRQFTQNLVGRVKNFSLPKNRPLIPLFEAVVNSLHAIEERRAQDELFSDGNIEISVLRDQQGSFDGDLAPIDGFLVMDNGIGFNEDNMKSFLDADSTYKADIGGKGVGRFSWLKAFGFVSVKSVFSDNGTLMKRSFDYKAENTGVDDAIVDANEGEEQQTTVRLSSCLADYRGEMPKRLEVIGRRIVQHCLIYFLDERCPTFILRDDQNIEAPINLNKLFKDKMQTAENTATLTVENKTFSLLHVKVSDRSFAEKGHRLYLCANSRLVRSEKLGEYIADLDRELFQRDGFWYIGVLTGRYLDENVDMNRLSFGIPESTANMISPASMSSIIEGACGIVEEYLKDYLTPIGEKKTERIANYVTKTAPQFRHLLRYAPREIAKKIKPNFTDDQLDEALYDIKRQFDRQNKKEQAELLKQLDDEAVNPDSYEHQFRQGVQKISDANSAMLAEYVTHRRVILDLLERGLRKKADGRFNLEKYMHELIYPQRHTSEDTPYEAHNLWLIDETLAYCGYISSDVPFDNNPHEDRPDILILDSPVAVSDSENDGLAFDSIVIFELKKPMRDDYTAEDNPVEQLYKYVKKLRGGKTKDKYGRIIHVDNATKYYLYAVCDITPSLLERIDGREDFTPTPDGRGYYDFNKKFNAYIEILSYDKILADAKKRNRVLFDKLGI